MVLIDYDETIETAEATKIDVWYNPHIRLWEITKMDDEGNMIGETAYAYGKKQAMKVKAEMEAELEA